MTKPQEEAEKLALCALLTLQRASLIKITDHSVGHSIATDYLVTETNLAAHLARIEELVKLNSALNAVAKAAEDSQEMSRASEGCECSQCKLIHALDALRESGWRPTE